MDILNIFNLIIGVVCLYWGIIGKGYPYKVNYPKKIKKYNNKLIRITLLVEGPLSLGMFAIPRFASDENGALPQPWHTINIIIWVLAIVVLILYVVLLYSKYGKEILAVNKNNQKPKYYK